jgi:AcrR family transcriptional regulator
VVKERGLRADAERNRRKVLEVAEAVFAAEGLAVPIDEIARRAGLGIGTLYRHFPTKEALFAAIVVTRMTDVVADAQATLDAGAGADPFFAFLTRMVGGWGQKKDFVDALHSAGADLDPIVKVKRGLHDVLGKLLERAQRAGEVKNGVTIQEILALLSGAFSSSDRSGITPAGRERMLAVIFDGLRATPANAKTKAKVKTKSRTSGARVG